MRGISVGVVQAGIMAMLVCGMTGCGDSDSLNHPPTGGGNTPKATNTTAVALATATRTLTHAAVAGTATPTPTVTPPSVSGNYTSAITLAGGRSANLNLVVQASGAATGSLEIVGLAASALTRSALGSLYARAAVNVSLGFVSISGTIDPATGAFHFSGNISIGGQSTAFDLSGSVPLTPGGSGSVTAVINGDTFTSTIGVGAGPTPLPTQAGAPTNTPAASGCDHGVFDITVSNPVASNVSTSTVTLGKGNALDTPDSTPGRFVWVITGNLCETPLGTLLRSLVIRGLGVTSEIVPGSYPIGVGSNGIFAIAFSESPQVANPADRFLHMWDATGGTLVIEDAGGGALHLRVSGAPMAPSTLIQGAEGTFTLDIDGTITSVM